MAFGMGTERLYCAIFHFPPNNTTTPDPRHTPRFGVFSISSNHAVLRSAEKAMCRWRAAKLQPDFTLKRAFVDVRNSVTVQRAVASVPMNTPFGAKWPKLP